MEKGKSSDHVDTANLMRIADEAARKYLEENEAKTVGYDGLKHAIFDAIEKKDPVEKSRVGAVERVDIIEQTATRYKDRIQA